MEIMWAFRAPGHLCGGTIATVLMPTKVYERLVCSLCVCGCGRFGGHSVTKRRTFCAPNLVISVSRPTRSRYINKLEWSEHLPLKKSGICTYVCKFEYAHLPTNQRCWFLSLVSRIAGVLISFPSKRNWWIGVKRTKSNGWGSSANNRH